MGWIESRNDKHRAVYRDSAGVKQRSPWMTYRPTAQAWLDRHEPLSKLGVGHDPRAGLITLREWKKVWWDTRVVEPTSHASDVGRMERILDEFGDYPLAGLTAMPIQAWAKRMLKAGSAPGTVAKYVHLLSAAMSAAVLARKIQENPCRYVTLPPASPGRETFLSHDQVDAVDVHLTDPKGDGSLILPDGTVAYTLAYTGLRWGELVGLHLGRVDFLRRQIEVVDVAVQVSYDFYLKEYPKGQSRRWVPLPQHLLERLSLHVKNHPPAPCGLPVGSLAGKPHRNCSGLVFVTSDAGRHRRVGLPMSRQAYLRERFRPAAVRAGLPADVRVHDLRHTCASWLVQAGVPVREVQQILGHKSITTTERYSHLAPDAGERSRAALERPISRGSLGAAGPSHTT